MSPPPVDYKPIEISVTKDDFQETRAIILEAVDKLRADNAALLNALNNVTTNTGDITSKLNTQATASKQDAQSALLTAISNTLISILSRLAAPTGLTVTTTNVLLASTVIAAANPNRKGFIIFNNSSNSTYVTFGNTSVASTCTRLIATFASWEMVAGAVYTGAISAIRNSGSGQVTVYELT